MCAGTLSAWPTPFGVSVLSIGTSRIPITNIQANDSLNDSLTDNGSMWLCACRRDASAGVLVAQLKDPRRRIGLRADRCVTCCVPASSDLSTNLRSCFDSRVSPSSVFGCWFALCCALPDVLYPAFQPCPRMALTVITALAAFDCLRVAVSMSSSVSFKGSSPVEMCGFVRSNQVRTIRPPGLVVRCCSRLALRSAAACKLDSHLLLWDLAGYPASAQPGRAINHLRYSARRVAGVSRWTVLK